MRITFSNSWIFKNKSLQRMSSLMLEIASIVLFLVRTAHKIHQRKSFERKRVHCLLINESSNAKLQVTTLSGFSITQDHRPPSKALWIFMIWKEVWPLQTNMLVLWKWYMTWSKHLSDNERAVILAQFEILTNKSMKIMNMTFSDRLEERTLLFSMAKGLRSKIHSLCLLTNHQHQFSNLVS